MNITKFAKRMTASNDAYLDGHIDRDKWTEDRLVFFAVMARNNWTFEQVDAECRRLQKAAHQ